MVYISGYKYTKNKRIGEYIYLFLENILPRCTNKVKGMYKVSDIIDKFIDNMSNFTLVGYKDRKSKTEKAGLSRVPDGIDYSLDEAIFSFKGYSISINELEKLPKED